MRGSTNLGFISCRSHGLRCNREKHWSEIYCSACWVESKLQTVEYIFNIFHFWYIFSDKMNQLLLPINCFYSGTKSTSTPLKPIFHILIFPMILSWNMNNLLMLFRRLYVTKFGYVIIAHFTNSWVQFNRRQTNKVVHALSSQTTLSTSPNIYFEIPYWYASMVPS